VSTWRVGKGKGKLSGVLDYRPTSSQPPLQFASFQGFWDPSRPIGDLTHSAIDLSFLTVGIHQGLLA